MVTTISSDRNRYSSFTDGTFWRDIYLCLFDARNFKVLFYYKKKMFVRKYVQVFKLISMLHWAWLWNKYGIRYELKIKFVFFKSVVEGRKNSVYCSFIKSNKFVWYSSVTCEVIWLIQDFNLLEDHAYIIKRNYVKFEQFSSSKNNHHYVKTLLL